MRLYPIFLKLENVSCAVIGAGSVALRKVRLLLESKAIVTVVSPQICSGLLAIKKRNKFIYKKSKYAKKFLRGKTLVIAATNDKKVNEEIAADALGMSLLVNVVDSPNECNFYVPAVLHKNGISMAISSHGELPGLAKKIKQDCAHIFDNYAKSFKGMSRLRNEIYSSNDTLNNKKIYAKSLVQADVLKRVETKKILNVNDLKEYLNKR